MLAALPAEQLHGALHQRLGERGVGGAAAGDVGEVAEGVAVLRVQLGLGEEADPVGVRLVPLVGLGEGVLGHADGALAAAGLAHVGVGAGLHRIQHGLDAGARAVPAAVLGEVDELQGVLGPAEVDHLAAHVGEHVGAERPVAGLLGGVQGEHEVLLRGGLEPHVVRHPARQLGEFGGDLEQPLGGGLGLRLLEEVGDLVELADDGLAAQPAAALGVPLPEHHGGGLQQVQLRLGEPAAGARRGGGDVRLGPGQRGGRGGDEPALHGLDEGRARGEGQRAPEEAAPRQHEVAARELAEQGHGLRARPGKVDAGGGGGGAGGAQAQVLHGDDDAEALREQLGQDAGDGLARVLPVQPAADAGGVGGDVVGAQLPGSAVHLAGELALGPAAADEPRGEQLVRALLRTRRTGPATAVAAHWNAPIPEDHLSPSAPSPIRMPVVGAARPAVATLRTESRVASGIPTSACAPSKPCTHSNPMITRPTMAEPQSPPFATPSNERTVAVPRLT